MYTARWIPDYRLTVDDRFFDVEDAVSVHAVVLFLDPAKVRVEAKKMLYA